ncbi:hypothetical protein MtrunA17_Chr6g0488431 [Medicago truncatula]|nr:protein EFFECTOR OF TRANSCRIPTION 2 [Medicago truncatula]RHN53160.1 hypothetical protein MtrunA17_Chr6g0488431 [Medicago truncatula]
MQMLKREQCDHTKHDSSFSHWKVLIDPSDWGNHGYTRYKKENLPQNFSVGVYELGVGSSTSDLGCEIYKLATDPHGVVVVYIGKSVDVRKILQSYSKDGGHLGDGCASGSLLRN